MKTTAALTVAFTTALSAATIAPGSPVEAGNELCSYSPATISVKIDPDFFEAWVGTEPPFDDAALSLFDPELVSIAATDNFTGDSYWTMPLTVDGMSYGPGEPTLTGGGFLLDSGEGPAGGLLYFLLMAGLTLQVEADTEFIADFPDEPSWIATVKDPESYPMSVKFVLESSPGADDGCSLTMNFSVGRSGSKPNRELECSNAYFDLCAFLEEEPTESALLPNTR